METKNKNLECDYLIVGAGAASLAFTDTLLTELPDSKIILIDKKSAPGGHWVHAYDFVRLHQASIAYGIASKQLEGNWLYSMLWKFTLPWNHHANKQEVLTYYDNFVNEKVESDQLGFYSNCVYNFKEGSLADDDGFHTFSSVDGSKSYKVKVNKKIIDGTPGECIIPCESPLQFPVDDRVQVMTPNQIYDAFQRDDNGSCLEKKYVVLGAGKTGMDCIIYLQRTMKVNPNDIAWVISNDVWMLCGGLPSDWPRSILKYSGDFHKTALALEQEGKFSRLDKEILPTKFRFPVIQKDDLLILQKTKTVIRRGRVTAIRNTDSEVVVKFGDGQPWEAFAPAEKCVFVHATSPGPFNGVYEKYTTVFENANKMTLRFLYEPPVTISYSCLAKIEAGRRNGTLDLDFGRRVFLALGGTSTDDSAQHTENDILNAIFRSFSIENLTQNRSILNLATFFAILDEDPMVGYNWMKANRLSLLPIPDAKCETYESLVMMLSQGKALGLSDNDIAFIDLLSEKIKPLKGR